MPSDTLCSLVLSMAAQRGERPAIVTVHDGVLRTVTSNELASLVRATLAGFDALNLSAGDAIGIHSENRWEWLVLDIAATGRGIIVVPLDRSWSDRRLARVLERTRIRAVCIQGAEDVERFERIRRELPRFESIIAIDGGVTGEKIVSLEALVAEGRARIAAEPGLPERYLAVPRPHDPATIIHTGGSTGEPKGVVRTQENLSSRGWAMFPWDGDPQAPQEPTDEVLLDPLSFCHSAGRWWAHMTLARGRTLALPAGDEAVTLDELALLRPTHFSAVPRVILQLQRAVLPKVEASWEMLERGPTPEVAKRFVDELRAALGGRLRRIAWGGGPLASSLHSFFTVHGHITLACGYGGTEAGIISLQDDAGTFGAAGRTHGADVRLEDGEIVVSGPGVSPGYFENAEATARAQTEDGWWRTGDLGRIDETGEISILGRKSAMFNCREGTNIDPTELEQLLESDPFIREAILVGDRRAYLAALLVVDVERVLAEVGSNDAVEPFIRARIDRINDGVEPFERVERFAIVPGFPPEVRTITVANKIRIDRAAVDAVYASQLQSLYR